MSTEGLVTFTYSLQPKNSTDEIPHIGSASGSGSGENTELVSHENTELVYDIKATINTTTCLTLHHGWDIIGEIYPWYQFRSIEVSWSGISVCNILHYVTIFLPKFSIFCACMCMYIRISH